MKRTAGFGILALLFLAAVPPALAEEEGAESHGSHEAHHDLALFFGVTEEGSEEEATFGLEYEYRPHGMFGYGGLVDHAGGNIRTTILAPALFVHPAGGLKLVFAPGVEYLDDEDETEFALRLGLAWDFEIKERYIVAPTVNVDFVDGEEIWVYGVNLGLRLGRSESPAEPLKRYDLRHTPEWRNWSVLTRREGN